MTTIAVIVAAGRGIRANNDNSLNIPKQYRRLGNHTVLTKTLSAFLNHPAINAAITVIHPSDNDLYHQSIVALDHEPLPPVYGDATRQGSVLAGLRALKTAKPVTVLIHDAARPFVSMELIDRVTDGLKTHRAVLPALTVTDTIKRERSGGFVEETIDRSGLWRAQTPQGFYFEDILAAHEAAAKFESKQTFTDDASIAEWHGIDVALVKGAEKNIKLTTPEDFEQARQILKGAVMKCGKVRTGTGFDVHGFTKGDHVILCGVKIAHDKSLKGHSDADVALHALTDALLGTIAEGDIGTHFPPSDPKWKNAPSNLFLHDAAQRIEARGGRIENVDITLICETPKIGPHREAMRAKIAEFLTLDIGQVSVKATTTEGLGFTGRREGISAMAAASVWLPE